MYTRRNIRWSVILRFAWWQTIVFAGWSALGDTSEDPFENFVNDVPMTALCRTIEIDMRQMLGETDVAKPIQPVNDILM